MRIAENLEINGEPRHPKKDRHKQSYDQSSQLLFDVLRQDWRLPNHDTSREGTENGMHADEVRHQRQSNHDYQDEADNGHLDDKVIVRPANDSRNPAASDGEAKNEKCCRAENAKEHRSDYNPPLSPQTSEERENRPADGVIQDRSREDDLAEIAAEIVHLSEDGGDDFDGGNGQRCCEKERREQAPSRIGQNAVRQHLSEHVAA